MRLPLSELRLSEEFRTTLTHRPGLVLDWGHIRVPYHSGPRLKGYRRRLRVVVAQVQGQRLLLRPELVVLVDDDRPHWSQDRRPEPAQRWERYMGEAAEGEGEE